MHICQNRTPDNLTILKPILLFRGLIGHGVLLTILKEKRWRVDYGLDVSRSMLAVPYRAKDSPSPRAEFAHTDIAICLTCLTYYYEGLTDAQLEACFEQLFKADNPDQEYEEWIKDCRDDLSPTLHHLRGLNLEDPVQRTSTSSLNCALQSSHRLLPVYHRVPEVYEGVPTQALDEWMGSRSGPILFRPARDRILWDQR
jgi:hypothetical protein